MRQRHPLCQNRTMREVETWEQVGERVAAARSSLGLTQEQLAERAGLERTALAKVERGLRQLTALELSRLAAALNRPLDWFVLESPPAVVSRRAELALGVPPAQSIDDVLDGLSRDLELLRELGLLGQPTQRPTWPLPGSFAEAEDTAQQVRRLLGHPSGPLDDLQEIAQQLGLLAFLLVVEPREADGAYLSMDDWGLAVVNGSSRSGRRRFTLVHELGHHLFADAYSTDWTVGEDTTQPERLINAFSAHLLLPRVDAVRFWQEFRGGQSPRMAAIRLAVVYRMSWSALCSQLRNCGLIDHNMRDRLAAQLPRQSEFLELGIRPRDDAVPPSLPAGFSQAVLAGYRSYALSPARIVELLRGTLGSEDLPDPPILSEEVLLEEVGPPL